MHWICPLYKLSTCWVFVEVLSSGVFKWPEQWHDMLSIPKISQRLLLNHGWESKVYSSPQNTKMLGCTSSKRTHRWGQKGKKNDVVKQERRSSKRCYNNIVKELIFEDTAATRKWCEWTMAIFPYAGHCACVGSTCWALLCKCSRLCWATHGWPRNKGNVEPCWAKSLTRFKFDSTRLNTAQHLSTGCLNALNLLRACTVDKSSPFARGLMLTVRT